MIYKQANDVPSYFAPSVKELQYADTNSKNVANILLTALGLSTAGYGTKYLVESLHNAGLPSEVKPSKIIRKKLREFDSTIDNKYVYSDEAADKAIDAADEVDDLLETIKGETKKSSFIKKALGINISLFSSTPRRNGLQQNALDNYIANRQLAKFSNPLEKLDVAKVLGNKDITLASDLHYDPKTLKSDSVWTKYISGPLAKLGPQSAIPLSIALGGGIVAAPMLAKALVKSVEKAVPEPKRHTDFVNTAKQIYEEAEKELQDAGYRKDKEKLKNKKEAAAKSKEKPKDVISTTRAGGNPLTSMANLPTAAVAALLAYAAYKGMHGFDSGIDKAKNELSHQTNFLRGWRASNKLRDYNYSPLTVSLENEPDNNKKVKNLLEDLKDDSDIDFNPSEVRRLTSDYLELT